ncbi:hypothetical protein ACFLWU_02805 [Chloroflexota bacterium]
MIKTLKKKLFNLIKYQDGFALPSVLAVFAVGSLLIIPSINHVATNLNAGTMAQEEYMGILAADAGVEDALWKIKNDTPASFPYSYQITGVNGLSVDITIGEIESIAGEEVGETGGHEDWLVIEKLVTYDTGIYSYAISISNNGTGNIKIAKMLIDFPSGVEYVPGSTSSNITTPADADPAVSGSSTTGITLVWENSTPLPTISSDETEYHYFELSGPPGIGGMEGHGFVEAQRDDIGTVWDSDSIPYSITAQAKNTAEEVMATIKAGVWTGTELEISSWQVVR